MPHPKAKLHHLRTEAEAELVGQLAPKAIRDAAKQPLSVHLTDFVAELVTQQCSRKYVTLPRNRAGRPFSQCGWKRSVT